MNDPFQRHLEGAEDPPPERVDPHTLVEDPEFEEPPPGAGPPFGWWRFRPVEE